MKLFKELCLKVESNCFLANRIVELYPDQEKNKEGYEEVLKTLCAIEPSPCETTPNMQIKIKEAEDEFADGGKYITVDGWDPDKKETYGIDFTPWDGWLAMPIAVDSLDLPDLDIVCHCLFELTFYGWTPDSIKSVKDEMLGEMDAIEKAMDESERTGIPIEDLRDENGEPYVYTMDETFATIKELVKDVEDDDV